MRTLMLLARTMRPQQWAKNVIVFAALAFSENLFDHRMVMLTLFTFGLFCLVSSAVYILNDILDREADRHHPEKKNRPIASGELSISAPLIIAFILAVAGLAGGLWLRPIIFFILLGYIINNIAYSYYLKNMILVDVFSIALGFVLRVVAGAEAIHVEISTWIILCTILGSLFLAFSKRRSELSLQGEKAVNHRASLAEYSTYFLDQMIGVVTASTVMAYALWTMWPSVTEKFHTQKLPWTIPFVCYGIFRYLYLVHQKGEGGNPTKIFISDWPLLINIALWMISVILILYLNL